MKKLIMLFALCGLFISCKAADGSKGSSHNHFKSITITFTDWVTGQDSEYKIPLTFDYPWYEDSDEPYLYHGTGQVSGWIYIGNRDDQERDKWKSLVSNEHVEAVFIEEGNYSDDMFVVFSPRWYVKKISYSKAKGADNEKRPLTKPNNKKGGGGVAFNFEPPYDLKRYAKGGKYVLGEFIDTDELIHGGYDFSDWYGDNYDLDFQIRGYEKANEIRDKFNAAGFQTILDPARSSIGISYFTVMAAKKLWDFKDNRN